MKKTLIISILLLIPLFSITQNGKTKEELKKELGSIEAKIKDLKKESSKIQKEIDDLYGWHFKNFGTIGVNLSSFNNWYSNTKPNLLSGHITIVNNLYLKLNKEKYFWLSYFNINLGWKLSYNSDKDKENKGFEGKSDVFRFASTFGYKLGQNLALSTSIAYRGSFLKEFGDPSVFDFGLGVTWNPLKDLYLILNPVNYNWILSGADKSYKSSIGASLLIDYPHSFAALNLNSTLFGFLSYQSSHYSNWTWKNTISYTLWKYLGLGLSFGLKQDKQEAFNSKITDYPSLKETKNKLQTFVVLGLTYTL